MACNLPAVATDDPIRREIIGDAGVFVKDPHNLISYSQALQTALQIKWGDKPRHQALKYSWEKTIPLYEKLFKSLWTFLLSSPPTTKPGTLKNV